MAIPPLIVSSRPVAMYLSISVTNEVTLVPWTIIQVSIYICVFIGGETCSGGFRNSERRGQEYSLLLPQMCKSTHHAGIEYLYIMKLLNH